MSHDDLKANRTDALVAIGKSIVGAAPVVGPALGEVMGVLIPKQRLDRIVEFVSILDEKLRERLTVEDLKNLCKSEEVVDLIEDSLFHVARAISDSRRKYVANLLSQGLTQEQFEHATAKKMLRLLDQLTDEELIFLKFYSLEPTMHGGEPRKVDVFYKEHLSTLEPAPDMLGSRSMFRASVQRSYRENLIALGLIDEGKRITPFGDLFLQYIDDSHESYQSYFDED